MLRWQFRGVHGLLDASVDDLVGPAAARYAVNTVCEDVIINGILKRRNPLALSTWRDRTGLSELPPLVDCSARSVWADRVNIDLPALRSYAGAVYAETDAYLASASDLQPDDLTTRVLNALLLKLSRFCSSSFTR